MVSFNPTIVRRLLRSRPDVLVLSGGYQHLTTQLALVLAKVLEIPTVYRSDEFERIPSRRGPLIGLRNLIENATISSSDTVICPGLRAANYNVARGKKREAIFISPYTTEDDGFFIATTRRFRTEIQQCRKELGVPHENVLLYVGALSREKGILSLIEAFRSVLLEFPDTALVLAGKGPLEDALKVTAKMDLAQHLFLPGFIQGETKAKFYSIATVFVLPTQRDLWGIVVNEAMLSGLPVVTTVSAGASEMVINGASGLVLEEGTPANLAGAMKQLLTDEVLAAKMGARGREYAIREYNLTRRTQAVLAAMRHATGGK